MPKEDLLRALYGSGLAMMAISIPFFDAFTALGVIIALTAALMIRTAFPKPSKPLPLWSSEYALALILITAALSFAAASDRMLAAIRFLEMLTGAAIFYLVKAHGRHSPERLVSISGLMFFPFALVVLFSIAQAVTGDYLALIPRGMGGGLGAVKGRISSIFDSPNILAPYLLLALPFLLGISSVKASSPGEKTVLRILLVLGLASLVMTFSRNAWIAIVLSTALMIFLSTERRMKAALISALAIFICFAAFACVIKKDAVISHAYRQEPDRSRLITYRTALTMIRENPLSGVGLGNFRTAFPLYFSRGDISFFDGSAAWSAHDTLLQITAETGLPGGAAFIWFISALLCEIVRGRKRGPPEGAIIQGALWGILAMLLFGIFDCTISHHKCGFAFFFIAACAAGLAEGRNDAKLPDSSAGKDRDMHCEMNKDKAEGLTEAPEMPAPESETSGAPEEEGGGKAAR
jgi:O-antigen ligase